MKIQETNIDWTALDEITDRILDYATSQRSVKKEQNELEVEVSSCAASSDSLNEAEYNISTVETKTH